MIYRGVLLLNSSYVGCRRVEQISTIFSEDLSDREKWALEVPNEFASTKSAGVGESSYQHPSKFGVPWKRADLQRV